MNHRHKFFYYRYPGSYIFAVDPIWGFLCHCVPDAFATPRRHPWVCGRGCLQRKWTHVIRGRDCLKGTYQWRHFVFIRRNKTGLGCLRDQCESSPGAIPTAYLLGSTGKSILSHKCLFEILAARTMPRNQSGQPPKDPSPERIEARREAPRRGF